MTTETPRARLREQLAYARAGGHTKRFHTQQTLLTDTVGHHSFNVAWLTHFLGTHLNATERYTLLLAALEHDLPEAQFGDVPAPSKREMGIRDIWNDNERDLQHQMGFGYEDALSDEGRRILKLCDALDGAFYCCNERALGNRPIADCYKNFRAYVEEKRLDPDKRPMHVPFTMNNVIALENEVIQFLDDTWEKVNG